MCLFPPLISYSGSYSNVSDDDDVERPDTKFYYFYNLPVVKFISSTISYIFIHMNSYLSRNGIFSFIVERYGILSSTNSKFDVN